MKKLARKAEKAPKPKYKVVPSTQMQIPIKDFANGVIIREDEKMVKLIEAGAIPFRTLKTNKKNDVRVSFEKFLKNAPNSFQIKCVSVSADLSVQIENMEENIKNETIEECIELSEEYRQNLIEAQKHNVERKYYVVVSRDEKGKKNKNENVGEQIYRFNSYCASLAGYLRSCGNSAKPLNNNETANTLYMLLNRNGFKDEPFEEHYEKVYQRYYDYASDKDNIYIKPTEYLAPKQIYFNDKNYVLCDGRYYYYLYVAQDGYPSYVFPGWLDKFVDSFEGVDVDIYFRKKDNRKVRDNVRVVSSHTKLDLNSSGSDMTESFESALGIYQSARYINRCISDGQNIFDVSVLITVSGNDLEQLNEKVIQIMDEASSDDIKLRNLPYQNEQAFKSTLPLDMLDPRIEIKSKRNIPLEGASCFYPFTAFQLIHDDGLMIAQSLSGNTPVIPDFWYTKFVSNSLIFLCGMAGAGKTSFLEYIAVHGRAKNIPVFIVAPEKQDDYRRLCYAVGGQFIEIGPGSKYCINIMDILENDKNVEEEKMKIFGSGSGKDKISHLNSRIGTVFEFLHTNYPDMPQKEQAVLKSCIIETYKRKGITEDNESLWADEEHTHYKTMPILSDLCDVIKERGDEYETLYYSVKTLTEGSGAHFNGQTNINVNNKFFVIGTENNSKETKTLSSFLAEDFCQLKIREDRTTKTIYIVDEGWAMLNNPYTAEKMFEDAKILRGFMCMFIFGTQQMADVLNSPEGQAILKNSETRIIMKHKDEDIRYISEYIDLSETERRSIRNFNIGESLLLANQVRMPIYCNPSKFEQLLTWNDETTLRRYAEYIEEKRNREESERLAREMAEKAVPYSQLLGSEEEESLNSGLEKDYSSNLIRDIYYISSQELERQIEDERKELENG